MAADGQYANSNASPPPSDKVSAACVALIFGDKSRPRGAPTTFAAISVTRLSRPAAVLWRRRDAGRNLFARFRIAG